MVVKVWLPLVPLSVFVLVWGPRRLLWSQVAAAGLLWWPLLGFHLSWPPAAVMPSACSFIALFAHDIRTIYVTNSTIPQGDRKSVETRKRNLCFKIDLYQG